MSDAAERNARVVSTFLGIEDHGVLVASLTLDYDTGSLQGVSWFLRSTRAAPLLESILQVLGADSWEDAKGRYCRARIVGNYITAIGHITLPTWVEREVSVSGKPLQEKKR